jgi:hypothetical protein
MSETGLALLVCVECESRTHLEGDVGRQVATGRDVRKYTEAILAEFDRPRARGRGDLPR